MRIGILGGTFDPIHKGHLYLARKVLDKLSLDKIVFIPAYLPPHKKNIRITSPRDRYNMVRIAVANYKRFEVSDIEIRRKGRSYSVETLRQLRNKYRHPSEIFFITGSDSLHELDKWKDMDDIMGLCKFVVVKRPHFALRNLHSSFIVIDIHAKDISATAIRKRIRDRQGVNRLLPKRVTDYIKRHGLYSK